MKLDLNDSTDPTLARRNIIAGAVIVLTGDYLVWVSLRYDMGSAIRLGPGALPLVLGVLFAAFGIAIAVTNEDGDDMIAPIVWRPAVLVLASILAFALLVERAGLAPATAALVVISGLADRSHTWKSLTGLFLVLLVAVYLVFERVLGIPFTLIVGFE